MYLEPELLIVSLNTDVYNLKCLTLMQALRIKELEQQLDNIQLAVNPISLAKGAAR